MGKKTKIVFLSPVSSFKGGAEKCLFDFASNPAIDPVIVAPEEGPVLDAARARGWPCHVLPFGSVATVRRPFSFAKGMKTLISLMQAARGLGAIRSREGAVIVHSNGLKAHVINCVSRRLFGGKAVVHIHDIPYTKSEKLVWRILYALCDAMITVSRPCWPWGSLPERCFVIHNGTPLYDAPAGMNMREGGTVTLGFVGRLHPAKGLHLLLGWLRAALDEGLAVRLSVRGSYSEDAPDYEGRINKQIEDLRLGPHAGFLGHVADPEAVYRGLDIVVVPSETPDPLPRSVMESMARGIPVIGYPAGGITEMIEDGKTGFLARDTATFLDALRNLLRDSRGLAALSASAQRKIAEEFTLPGMHENVRRVYERLS